MGVAEGGQQQKNRSWEEGWRVLGKQPEEDQIGEIGVLHKAGGGK